MILIAGLGNPGEKYDRTRHNVGFAVINKLAAIFDVKLKNESKFEAEVAETTIMFPGEKKHVRVALAKPQTYMNESGRSIQKLVKYYRLRTEDQVWIIHDDLDLQLGQVRIRVNGSSGGQKGIDSIINALGTNHFVRFRIGITPTAGQPKAAEEYVLEKFRKEEQVIIDEEIQTVIEQINEALDKGITATTI
jgi:PTH1 family peptidyl-tRNA hydrolase